MSKLGLADLFQKHITLHQPIVIAELLLFYQVDFLSLCLLVAQRPVSRAIAKKILSAFNEVAETDYNLDELAWEEEETIPAPEPVSISSS